MNDFPFSLLATVILQKFGVQHEKQTDVRKEDFLVWQKFGVLKIQQGALADRSVEFKFQSLRKLALSFIEHAL